jgi:hypothetical protein
MKRISQITLITGLLFFMQSAFAGIGTPFVSMPLNQAGEDTISYVFIDYVRGAKLSTGNKLDFKVSCFSTPSVTIAVERSADGTTFEPLEQQFATATRCQQPFTFTDQAPKPGLNYYRVKTTDIDGAQTFSFTVPILNADKGLVMGRIMPNPVNSASTLQVTSAEKTTASIVISSLNGKQVRSLKVNLVAGSNEINLNMGNVAAGNYQLTLITNEGEKKGLRFIKQ